MALSIEPACGCDVGRDPVLCPWLVADGIDAGAGQIE
jgi:hypothetical protein